ncbi:thioredoxin domain-containing protein [Lysobacter korlensis]|uniref:Thioredoxin domain-containing protein n=1 Tax=Lysobacter korlensis TaxID=553636 RepID=A0ABV6RVL7_9GAMM
MSNRLAGAVSPYLRSHADNPVDWWPWGSEPFEEAARRDVPVMISIGYATCHWCHVMARESFSDPAIADLLNADFVSIKVDREEHPDVDSSYMAAAGAFTQNLGWPLTVFATPQGRTFFAGTYFPPVPIQGRGSFSQVLGAVLDAWRNRREQVEQNGAAIAQAIAARDLAPGRPLPERAALDAAVTALAQHEDQRYGGFGTEPKFPMAGVLLFLLDLADDGNAEAGALARRTLDAMAGSELRDPVEGGFFRYAVHRDWSEPHYERMLYDNALLLRAYARAGSADIAAGIASFLTSVLRLPSGAFASGQDSESTIDGKRVEGGYYLLPEADRRRHEPPPLDDKVLTGWNGLAIEALADAGQLLAREDWIEAARAAADYLLHEHLLDGRLLRATSDGRPSTASATLEDYGMFTGALLRLATATGEVRYASIARSLLDAVLEAGHPIGVPGGGDPVLTAHGLGLAVDPSEGAYPSGLSSTAGALVRLHALTAEARYREAAARALSMLGEAPVAAAASFGSALGVLTAMQREPEQLVVVAPAGSELARVATGWRHGVLAVVDEAQANAFAAAGFELFEGRTLRNGAAAAYLCRDFVCRLPITDPAELETALSAPDGIR